MNHITINCPCCNEDKNNLDSSINYVNKKFFSEHREEIFSDRKMHHCNKCNFSYSTPFLSDEILDQFYLNDFSKRRMNSMLVQAKIKFKFSLVSLQRIFFVSAFLNKKESHTILDFGGGAGATTSQFKNLLPNSNVNIDDNEGYNDIWKLRGLEKKSLNSYKDGEIDLFFSSHTFEHINANEHNNLLSFIKKKISKDGIVYIEVPNDDFSKFKNKDKLNEGCHVSHFTTKSLEILISKYFDIIDVNSRGDERLFSEKGNGNVYENIQDTYNKNPLKKLLYKLGLLKVAQSIMQYYHIFLPKKKDEKKKLIETMFFKKNIIAAKGSFITVLARNKI